MLKRLRLLKNKIDELEVYKEYRRKEIQARKDHIRDKKAIADQKRKDLLLMQRKISDKKLDLEVYEKQIECLNICLNQVNAGNEYSALRTEIGCKEDDKYFLESKILQLMTRLEIVDKECKELTEELECDEDGLKDFVRSVDEETLYHYKRLSNIKDGQSFAEVVDNVCGGCFMKITLQTINSLRSGKDLVLCPNCKRMLFINEKRQTN